MGGGGAGSGTVVYETYITEPFSWLLFDLGDVAHSRPSSATANAAVTDYNLIADIYLARTSQGGNPYVGQAAYDPSDDIDTMKLELADYEARIDALADEADWKSLVAAASAYDDRMVDDIDVERLPGVGEVGISQFSVPTFALAAAPVVGTINVPSITATEDMPTAYTVPDITIPDLAVGSMITALEDREAAPFLRSISQMTAGRVDINATDGTPMMMALAAMQNDKTRKLNDADIEITFQVAKAEFEAYLRIDLEANAQRVQVALTDYQAKTQAALQRQAKEFDGALQAEIRQVEIEFDADKIVYEGQLRKGLQEQELEVRVDTAAQQLVFQDRDTVRKINFDAVNEARRLGVEAALTVGKLRAVFLTQSVQTMVGMRQHRLDSQRFISSMYIDMAKLSIVAGVEENVRNMEFDVEEAMWDLHLYERADSHFSAIHGSGGHVIPKGMSGAQSAISGALSGAAAGSAIAPGVGTAIGAAAGFIGGLF